MNRTEFIGKLEALYVGDRNCFEELLTTYDELERLNNIIKKFEILIKNEINESKLEDDYDRVDSLEYCLATLQELKRRDSNE